MSDQPFLTNTAQTAGVPVVLKKSDLYSSLWRSCDELRGGMDASQYKD
jgi:type I restriction-modification system DNA methylase subunit